LSDAKQPIDCEDLVRWACERLPTTRPSKCAIDRGEDPLAFVAASDRELVGRWTKPAAFPMIQPMFAGGFAQVTRANNMRPPADALNVETAIRAVQIDMAPPNEIGHGIGFAVDIAHAWAWARRMAVNLLYAYGRLGDPPYADHAFAFSTVLAPNGKPGVWRTEMIEEEGVFGVIEAERIVRTQQNRRGQYESGAYCRMEIEPDPQVVVNDRAEYYTWRLGLDQVAAALEGRLDRFEVFPTAALRAPWIDAASAEIVICARKASGKAAGGFSPFAAVERASALAVLRAAKAD
jgi:hypothetical protein